MKTFQNLLAAALLTASFSTYAQTATQSPASQGPAATAGDMPPSTSAAAPASTASAASDASASAPADSKLPPAALAFRESLSNSSRMGRGRPAYNNYSRVPGYKDGVTMREGQVHVTQHGKTETLAAGDTATTFTHLLVNGNGTVQLTDGSSVKLEEGDHVSITGKLITKRMQFVQDSTAKAELKDKRKLAARQNRGIRGFVRNSF